MILFKILRKDGRYIFLSLLLLVMSVLGGCIFFQNRFYHLSKLSNDSFNNLVIHNGEMLIITFGLSFISVGYLALIEIGLNGFLFGMGIAILVNKYGILVSFILLIHSVFELPAMVIAAFLGRITVISLHSRLVKKRSKYCWKEWLFILIIMLLFLVLAGAIESIPRENILKVLYR